MAKKKEITEEASDLPDRYRQKHIYIVRCERVVGCQYRLRDRVWDAFNILKEK